MNWPLPLRQLELTSRLSPLEFERRLSAVTQQRWSWFVRPRLPIRFVGRVSTGLFRVVTIAEGRNTYAAWVLGRVQPSDAGIRISVRITLHPAAVLGMLGFFVGPQLLSVAGGEGPSGTWAVMMVGLHTGLCYFGFLPEARKAERALRELADP